MSEPVVETVAEALKLSRLLPEVYQDLAKPGVRQLGKALETVLGFGNTLLWPVTWANERTRIALERNLEKYRKAIASTPLEDITPAPPEIGVPVAEKLTYVTDESLSDMYVELLTTATKTATLSLAHPSFVNIINCLSPDEARLLEYLREHHRMPYIEGQALNKDSMVFVVLDQFIIPDDAVHLLTFPPNIPAYLSNISGLGLVHIEPGYKLTENDHYITMMEAHRKFLEKKIAKTPSLARYTVSFQKGLIEVTDYGKLFLRACVPNKS